MADNTTLDAGTGGDTIATDDIGGVKHQLVKVEFGAADSATQVSAAAPLPTVQTGALPAGANAIGKLAANSGVDIGDVDVTSMPGTAADGAAGLPATQPVIAGWDGTNVQAIATDSSGLLQVDVASAPTTAVTGPLTDAELRATPVPVSGTVTASGPLTDTQLRATAVPVSGPLTDTQLRATPVPVSGTVTASGPLTDTQLRATAVPVSGTVTINAIPAGTNNIGDVDVLTVPADPFGANADAAATAGSTGSVQAKLRLMTSQLDAIKTSVETLDNAIAGTEMQVDVVASLPAGTNNIGDVDVLTLPGVAGTVAHDGADSGNPVKVGARALTADITAVAANDRVDNISTILGKQVVQNYALPGQFTSGSLGTALANTTAADVIAAPGAGIRLYITEITVTNHHATVHTKVEIRDGTTVKKIVSACALGGGASITLPTPLRLTANTALTARNVTTGADVDVSATGYTAAE